MTEVPKSDDLPAVIDPPKRSCLGCAFKGGLGCAAFLGGVLLILGLFGPEWLAGWVAIGLRDKFNDEYAGSIDGVDFELSWSERQHLRGLRLLDPDGEVVLLFDLEFPGVLEVIDGWRTSDALALGRIQCDVTGEIIADETGRTNLERALESTQPPRNRSGTQTVTINGRSVEDTRADFLHSLEVVLDVKSASLTFSSLQSDELGVPVELRNLEARLRTRPDGGAWTFTADADIVSETQGRLDLSLTAWEPDWYNHEWPLGVVSGEVDVTGLSTSLLDGLAGQNGRLVQALGSTLNLNLDVNDVTAHKGTVSFGIDSDHQDLTFEGHFSEGGFRMDAGEQLSWNMDAPLALIEPLMADALPEGVRLELLEADQRWSVEVTELVLPVLGTSGPGEDRLLGMLSSASFKARFEAAGVAVERAGFGPLRLQESAISIEQDGRGLVAVVAFVLNSEAQGQPARIGLEMRPRDAWESVLGDGKTLAWAADLTFEDLELANLLRGQGVEHEQLSLFEGSFEGGAQVRRGRGARALLGGHLKGDSLRLTLADLWTDETHLARSAVDDFLVVELDPTVLTQLVDANLPEGMQVGFPDGKQRLVFEKLELPRVDSGSNDFDLQALEAQLRLEVDTLGLTLEDTDEVVLSAIRGTLAVGSQASPQFTLDAGVLGHEACALHLEATSLVSFEEALQAEDYANLKFSLNANAHSVPSSLVDSFAKQDGLIVDVLGPTLDLECRSEALTSESGPLTLHMASGNGTLDWSGELRDGVLFSSGEDRLTAEVGLSPLLSERVIGTLIPFMVEATKEPDSDPVAISLSDCSLPLGGDLSQVNGKLNLDLGAVQYRVLPQLEELLGDTTRLKSSVIAPIEIQIVNGLATYENLEIEIGDKAYAFKGSIELESQALNFETEVPLKNLGDRVGKNVQRLVRKGLVSPDVAVPVTLRGTPKSPRVGFRDGFLESLTKGLLPGALDEAVKGLFDKLLGDD